MTYHVEGDPVRRTRAAAVAHRYALARMRARAHDVEDRAVELARTTPLRFEAAVEVAIDERKGKVSALEIADARRFHGAGKCIGVAVAAVVGAVAFAILIVPVILVAVAAGIRGGIRRHRGGPTR